MLPCYAEKIRKLETKHHLNKTPNLENVQKKGLRVRLEVGQGELHM